MTVTVSLPSHLVRIEGAADLDPGVDGVRPRRLPAWTRPRLHDAGMDLAVSTPVGVRLRLRTAAREIALGVHVRVMGESVRDRLPASFDLLLDGSVHSRVLATAGDTLVIADEIARSRLVPGEPETIRFRDLPAGEKSVEIWLPHTASVELRTITVDAPLLVPDAGRGPRWVHHGSSISHGLEAAAPTSTWPAQAALRAGAALVDLAFAGNAVLDPDVARTIADLPADLITLKIGANIVAAALMRERTFVPAVHGFLDLIRTGHPTTPVTVITPISCPALEHSPGPVRLDTATGQIVGNGVPTDGALTMVRVRELLADVVAVRADPELRLVDGRELFGPTDVGALEDGLHPDAAAHLVMGERAVRLLLDGPLAELFEQYRTSFSARAEVAR